MEGRASQPELAKNLVLVGARGCGKTSVARRLARQVRAFTLFSLDALVRYEARGRTIEQIVRSEGWTGFREREWQVVRRVALFRGGALVDTGGGVVADLDARGRERYSRRKVDALRRHGWVVYLERDPGYLVRRAGGDPTRPALATGESPREIVARRDAWYRRAADCVLACDGLAKDAIAERVLERFYAAPGVRAR